MKYSKQRNLILETVIRNPIHPTADQVYTQLHEANPNISLGTVYRNLNLLSEIGQLRRISVANGCDRFDGRLDSHFHMICDECEKVIDVEMDFDTDIEKSVEEKTGYIVKKLDLVFNGVCPDCQKKIGTSVIQSVSQ